MLFLLLLQNPELETSNLSEESLEKENIKQEQPCMTLLMILVTNQEKIIL